MLSDLDNLRDDYEKSFPKLKAPNTDILQLVKLENVWPVPNNVNIITSKSGNTSPTILDLILEKVVLTSSDHNIIGNIKRDLSVIAKSLRVNL